MYNQFDQAESEPLPEVDARDIELEVDSAPSLFALAVLFGALGLSFADSMPGGITATIGFIVGFTLGLVAVAIIVKLRELQPGLSMVVHGPAEQATHCPNCGDTITVQVLQWRRSGKETRSYGNG